MDSWSAFEFHRKETKNPCFGTEILIWIFHPKKHPYSWRKLRFGHRRLKFKLIPMSTIIALLSLMIHQLLVLSFPKVRNVKWAWQLQQFSPDSSSNYFHLRNAAIFPSLRHKHLNNQPTGNARTNSCPGRSFQIVCNRFSELEKKSNILSAVFRWVSSNGSFAWGFT